MENENMPEPKGSGTGAWASIIFFIVVTIGMIILAHFKGN